MHEGIIERTVVTRHADSRCIERAISANARKLVLRHHDRVQRSRRGRVLLGLTDERLEWLAILGIPEELLEEARDVVLVVLRGRPPQHRLCILTAYRRTLRPN